MRTKTSQSARLFSFAPLRLCAFALILLLLHAGVALGAAGGPKRSITLIWDPSPSVSVEVVGSGYNVYSGSTPTNMAVVATLGPVTNITFSSLANGTFYYAVTARVPLNATNSIESDFSNIVSVTIPQPPGRLSVQ